MATSAEQIRAYQGPALLSFGLRPFFLFGSIWAAITVALWLPLRTGDLPLPSVFGPLEWHVHELVYGYVPAIICGFLLTAVPNWTGRLPVVGMPLLALLLVWVAGRIAVFFSASIGPATVAIVDIAFLVALAGTVAREIIAGKNTRNLKVLIVVALLVAGNVAFHVEANIASGTDYGTRIGISATILLITLIGGRIVPSFTRNWLSRREAGRLPVPFNRFDIASMLIAVAGLVSWCLFPEHPATALVAVVAAITHFIRLSRWAGERTVAEPLVLILHVAYCFVPIGFMLLAGGIIRPGWIAPSGAIHAWTAGAIGLMTLAVMTRASLGHTGRPLTATPMIRIIYLAAFAAALARIAASVDVFADQMLVGSATCWVLAFTCFVVVYAPILSTPRR